MDYSIEGLTRGGEKLKILLFQSVELASEYLETPRSVLFDNFKDNIMLIKDCTAELKKTFDSVKHSLPINISNELDSSITVCG